MTFIGKQGILIPMTLDEQKQQERTQKTRHTLNELLVGLFNYILYIEANNLKQKGVELSINEVHILESIERASSNTMSHMARRLMITSGTLTTNISRLEKKGYVERYQDEKDRRIVRIRNTPKALDVLKIHDEFHKNMIDKAIGDLGLDENEVLNEALENILEYFSDEYSDQTKGAQHSAVLAEFFLCIDKKI